MRHWGSVRAALAAQPLIILWPRLGAAGPMCSALRELGLTPIGSLGVLRGQHLPEGLGTTFVLDSGNPSRELTNAPCDEFAHFEARMGALPEEARAWLDTIDPGREAAFLVPSAACLDRVADRPVFGPVNLRTRAAVEDKTCIDALWATLSIPHAPSGVFPLAEASHAAPRFDLGQGTVWAGDNTTRIEGGATTTRHVFDTHSLQAATELFTGRCASVRIMPYLPGVPAAIQAMVIGKEVAVFRPMEMLVLRQPRSGRFQLCGISSLYDPPAPIRAEMRALARTVGQHLERHYAWQGGFSIDGIVTDKGFVPTEINARFSAGLSLLASALSPPPLSLIDRALRHGSPLNLSAQDVERAILPALDARRLVDVHLAGLPEPPEPALSVNLRPSPQGWVRCAEPGPVRLRWQDAGGFGLLTFDPMEAALRKGPPLAPLLAHAIKIATEYWDLPVETLEPALGITN